MQRSFFWLCSLIFVFGFAVPLVTSADSYTLQGWGWSSNIGWVKFANDGQNWNVVIDKDSGFFDGYAWSNNIGWVKFDERLAGPDGAPDPHGVQLHYGDDGIGNEGDSVTGWARACSVAVDCNFNNLKPDSARGGWDGWLWFGSDYGGGGGGGGDGFWWWHDRGDNWWWNVFECNDGKENDPEPDGIDTGDPDCYTPDGDYIFYWPEASRNNNNWFGWLGNLVERAFAQGGDGQERIAGFGWGADVIGWLFVDLEIDGDEEPPPPSVDLVANGDPNGNDKLTIDEGVPVNLVWESADAIECLAESDVTWDGDKPLDGNDQVTGLLPGTHYFKLTCSNDLNESVYDQVDVLVEGAESEITVELLAGDGETEDSQDLDTDTQHQITLRWETTNDPDQCTAGWDGQPRPDNGQDPAFGPLSEGDYQYSLSCTKGNNEPVVNFVNVHVREPGNDPCELSGLEVVGDGVIEITSQPLDHEVLSSLERITNTCTEAINVSVKDILSMTYDRGQGGSGSLISAGGLKHPPENNQLTGILGSNQQLPKCVLSVDSDRTRRDCTSASLSLPSGGTATFGIEIWRPIKTIKDYQPYRVSLGDPNSDARGRNAEIRFEYRVGNVIDE